MLGYTKESLYFPLPLKDRIYALVVRVPGYRSRGPASIPSNTGFSEN
jgi:hypothetical protein